jgi:hypothetical protein
VRSGGQSTAIVITEAQSLLPELAPQEPVLFDQVRDRLPLPAVQPAGEHAQHHLQRRGVDHGVELISRTGLKDVARVVEHYAMDFSTGTTPRRARIWRSRRTLPCRVRSRH